jgi:hypothetical protein
VSLFAKDKPLKRVEFENDAWVELKYLSKGFKNQIENDIANIARGFEFEYKDGKVESKDGALLPEDVLQKLHSIEYRKISAAIAKWSEGDKETITIDNVKQLDDEVYNKILMTVDEMNGLNETERKN